MKENGDTQSITINSIGSSQHANEDSEYEIEDNNSQKRVLEQQEVVVEVDSPTTDIFEGNKIKPKEREEDEEEINKECCICLDDIEGDTGALLNTCHHIFHYTCIMEWSSRSNTCPLCKERFKKVIRIQTVTNQKTIEEIPIEHVEQAPPYQEELPSGYVLSRQRPTRVRNVYGSHIYPPILRIILIISLFITIFIILASGATYAAVASILLQNAENVTIHHYYNRFVYLGFLIAWVFITAFEVVIVIIHGIMLKSMRPILLQIFRGITLLHTIVVSSVCVTIGIILATLLRDAFASLHFFVPLAFTMVKLLIWMLISLLYERVIYPNHCSCIPRI